MNKRKIINDPIYGFITIPSDLIYDIIEHPYFQRLRRIKQLGLTDLVYPGANHTRFHHALGAMHLMKITLDGLRNKGHFIYDSEYEAALIAILLHDVGHGPFSHTLESALLNSVKHEDISLAIIKHLDQHFQGKLSFAQQVFKNEYPRKFLNQLVASQLDIDRLDYLKRDSFFTGVSEGTIGADRIIKMLNVVNDELVVEEKGIYSIENFLSARRLMYWQVYLHKTTICAEKMLIKVIQRAKELVRAGELDCPNTNLSLFLSSDYSISDFTNNSKVLDSYCSLDDMDVWGAMKLWVNHKDPILKNLCQGIISRKLFQIRLLEKPPSEQHLEELRGLIASQYQLSDNADYYLATGKVSNAAYIPEGHINILAKSGQVVDVAEATDLPNIQAMKKIVVKYYVCWPKEIEFAFTE